MLSLKDFLYALPEELIAQKPLATRDESRLLCYGPSNIVDAPFLQLPDFLEKGALLILNNTRVIPSRLFGHTETGGKAEVLLLEKVSEATEQKWLALGRPLKKFRKGFKIAFAEGCVGTICEEAASAPDQTTPFQIEFNLQDEVFARWLSQHGYIPLPPYIERKDPKPARESEDREPYQTVYAQNEGSAAAPTAGLHFTPRVFRKLAEKGVDVAYVTLHVGAGTFLPVKTERLEDHVMHEERYLVPRATLAAIEKAQQEERPIYAVGTTSLRCLEALHEEYRSMGAKQGAVDRWHRTRLFIRPSDRSSRYTPWCVQGLITNFHQPGSTLFMLISALVGLDEAQKIYRHAVERKYRFFSYGDSCFLKFR